MSINRLLSRRDKHLHKQHLEKSKQRSSSSNLHLHGLYHDDDESISEKGNAPKVKAVKEKMASIGISTFSTEDVEYVLQGPFANGDSEKAFDLLVLLDESENGIIKEYKPDVKLLGAVNRKNVTCFLDATLFAMFARLDTFEAILFDSFDDPKKKRLSILIRLWVNSLRSGKLITVDITRQLQEAIADCGWTAAIDQGQQDASEAFSNITEMLQLPMLTLKMDIFHPGKEDLEGDHKIIRERLLEVAIPDTPEDGSAIHLEDCFHEYFNGKIDVARMIERSGTTASTKSRWSLDSMKAQAMHAEFSEVNESQLATPVATRPQSSLPPPYTTTEADAGTTIPSTQRSPSVIQDFYYNPDFKELAVASPIGDDASPSSGRQRAGSLRKAVMMPAWQFFSLIPWYTGDDIPTSDAQVAAHFSSKRPVLGICLKRYTQDKNGNLVRRGTHVDIPIEIGLPHFIHEETKVGEEVTFGNFKLSLQSVVCHRGESINSGHYVSLVRGLAPSSEHLIKHEDQWVLFDDLAKERVRPVDIQKALVDECPYLLFYQVQPIEGDPGNIEDSRKAPSEVSVPDSAVAGLRKESSELHNDRPSIELNGTIESSSTSGERPSTSSNRRPSISFTDETYGSAEKGDHQPDALNSGPMTPGTASRTVSRRNSRTGRSGENRLSTSLSRMTSKLGMNRTEITIDGLDPNESHDPQTPKTSQTPAVFSPQTSAGRLAKKEVREKSKTRRSMSHHRLMKGKDKLGNPDRECVVM